MGLTPYRGFFSFLGGSRDRPRNDLLSPEDRATVRLVRRAYPPMARDAISSPPRAYLERVLEVIERVAPDPRKLDA